MASEAMMLNELRAELTVCRVTIQMMLIRIISADPAYAEEHLLDIKSSVTAALGRMETDPANPGTEKAKHLTLSCGADFFAELEGHLSSVRKMRGESGRN